MTHYILRRLLILPVLLFTLSILIFALLQAVDPKERAALYIKSPPKTTEALQAVIEKYGLDQPFYVQYWNWMKRILQGDLGWSETAKMPVWEAIGTYFPATLELVLWSIIPIVAIGIWFGVFAAIHHDRFNDHLVRLLGILSYSIPTFLFCLLALMLFYARLHWFPPGRLSDWANAIVYSGEFHLFTGMYTVDALLNRRVDIFIDALRHLLLPVLTLVVVNWALFMRMTRSSVLGVMPSDYIRTARAKGLPERRVINHHTLPNALIPIVTISGLFLVGMLSGVAIIELIFNFPGMGMFTINAAKNFDVVTVLAVTLLSASLLLIVNLGVDILYGFLDPRIRLG